MTDWKRKIKIKQFLTEDNSLETVKRVANQIEEALSKDRD